MNRENILPILYDLSLVIGGEIKLAPLLTKTLQRFLFHTAFPCGMIFVDVPQPGPEETGKEFVPARLELSIGDFELARYNGRAMELPAALLRGGVELLENRALLGALPGRKDHYSAFLRLPVGAFGVILLLSPVMPAPDVPFTHIFQPILSNLARSILLCKSNEEYTRRLIAGQKTAETAFQDLSYRNQLILDSVGEGICGVDQNGKVTFANPAAAKMLGYPPEELSGALFHELVHHRMNDGSAINFEGCPLMQTVRTGSRYRISDDVFYRRNGTPFPVEYVSTPLHDAGRTSGAVLVFQDITERKKIEEDLRQREELLRTIYEATPECIKLLAPDGSLLNMNKAGLEMIEAENIEEVKGKDIACLVAPAYVDAFRQLSKEVFQGKPGSLEFEATGLHGRRVWLDTRAVPLRNPRGDVFALLGVTRDITGRKAAEGRTGVINSLIELFTRNVSRSDYLNAAAEVIRGWSGCRNVGIRLANSGGRLAFEAVTGYNQAFLESEKVLNLAADECVCTRVASGRADSQDGAVMTSSGSFYSNNSVEFITGLPESEKTRYRGACVRHGYRSLAVIPLRCRGKTLGIIHLADELPGIVPLDNVQFLERMAYVIAEALFRFGIEDDLRNNLNELSATTELLAEQKRFAESLVAHSAVPTFVLNPDHKVVLWNKACEEVTGIAAEDVIGTSNQWRPFYPQQRPTLADVIIDGASSRLDALYGTWSRSLLAEKGLRAEGWFPDVNNKKRFMVFEAVPVYSSKGELTVVLETLHDITDRKQSETDLQKLNRALQTLSTCNMTLIHARQEDVLLQNICRILTEVGGFTMVWVGYTEQDENRTIRPVAWAGAEEGYLSAFPLAWSEDCSYPAAVSIRSEKPFVAQNIAALPGQAPWRAEALKRGYAACIVFPLHFNSHVFGTLNIFANEPDVFTNEEIGLLSELAGDLAFGIVTLRTVTERDNAIEERQSYLEKLRKGMVDTIQAVASIVEIRDPYISGHQRRVAQLAVALAGEMGLEQTRIEGIHFGSLVHDIGKIYVPAEFLSRPGKLMDLEFSLIKTHTEVGYNILKDIDFPWPVAQMVRQHHEAINGSGYPQGLQGDEIIFEARIIAVADSVEAMASHRPYRPARGIDIALREITAGRGVQYDPGVVDACLRLFREKGFAFT